MTATIITNGITVEDLTNLVRSAVKAEIQSLPTSPPKDEVIYLSRRQTADKLKVTPVTLSNWVNDGKIAAYKVGGRVLFRLDEVEAAASAIVPLKYKK